jgi:hypothetical protein
MRLAARIIFLILSLIFGGLIFQVKIELGFGLLTFYLFIPCFVISSLISVLITTKTKIRFIHKRFSGFFVWSISIISLFLILTVIHSLRNWSPVLISTKFYWEEGVDIEFRENRTYKAVNHDMFGGYLTYGRYELKDSTIVLKDKLKFGMENMSDTLRVSKSGISFTMDVPWRISEGKMSFEYMPKTKIDIINNIENDIDNISIELSYTKQNVRTSSVGSKQSITYDFDMENPYVNGNYIFTYKIRDQANKKNEIRNILYGYPLETVESIRFEEEYISFNLIFGQEIIKNYR